MALPACGTAGEAILDASTDAPADASGADATLDAATDAADEATVDDGSVEIPDVGPPDGCTIVGKPDSAVICYSELLPDPIVCGVDLDADTQEATVCAQLCSPLETTCYWYDLGDGGTLTCGFCNPGRLDATIHADLGPRCFQPTLDAAEYLARSAYLEAASVRSFHRLERELTLHGASVALRRDARRAAADEVRHARAMRSLARRRGASVARRPPRAGAAARSLLALAIENAIEGCVRETFSAALAAWQSARATDPEVRATMKPIARDEARHAALAWRVASWADAKLDEAGRAAVRAARARAVAELSRSLEASTPCEALGVPDARSARGLFDSLRDTLWS